jgi:hypothetical protein
MAVGPAGRPSGNGIVAPDFDRISVLRRAVPPIQQDDGAIGGVIVMVLWFHLSGLVLLFGAKFNSEIEHASPFGKAEGEKVPGEHRGWPFRSTRHIGSAKRLSSGSHHTRHAGSPQAVCCTPSHTPIR